MGMGPPEGPALPLRRRLALAGILLALCPARPAQAQDRPLLTVVDGARVRKAVDGMLGLMGFLVVPDMAASSIQVNRSSKEGDTGLSLTQLGSGFTVDPSFPLYMEGFLGYSRVDPRFLFSDGQTETRLPVRWNSVAASGGLGWDFPLAEHLVLRQIVNISLGHVESDVSLFARYLNLKYDVNLRFLKGGQLNNYGYGGALVLDYSLAREHIEVDIELRYSQMLLQTFASSAAVQGQSVPKTVGLWTRFRFPTPYEVFSRPLRTVFELSHSEFFGSEARTLGFETMTKVGGGLEVDVGRYEIGGLGLYAQRVRMMGRAVFGPHVRGVSVGIGVSF
jgi:hypothetical protein